MVALGFADPPDPTGPGMFRLAGDGALREVLESGGFVDVEVRPVELKREYTEIGGYIDETIELSPMMGSTFRGLPEEDRRQIIDRITAGAQPFIAADGSVTLPGSSLIAVAGA